MESFKLTFAEIIKHDPYLAEVIVNEGVVITTNLVKEFHQWINDNLDNPTYLLINRLNSYSYTVTSQRQMGNLDQIKSVAVVSYNEKSRLQTKRLKSRNQGHWKLRQFDNVGDAMSWLY